MASIASILGKKGVVLAWAKLFLCSLQALLALVFWCGNIEKFNVNGPKLCSLGEYADKGQCQGPLQEENSGYFSGGHAHGLISQAAFFATTRLARTSKDFMYTTGLTLCVPWPVLQKGFLAKQSTAVQDTSAASPEYNVWGPRTHHLAVPHSAGVARCSGQSSPYRQ